MIFLKRSSILFSIQVKVNKGKTRIDKEVIKEQSETLKSIHLFSYVFSSVVSRKGHAKDKITCLRRVSVRKLYVLTSLCYVTLILSKEKMKHSNTGSV